MMPMMAMKVVMMAMLAIRHMIVMRLVRMDMMMWCARECTMINVLFLLQKVTVSAVQKSPGAFKRCGSTCDWGRRCFFLSFFLST